jgi:hypothetical protein
VVQVLGKLFFADLGFKRARVCGALALKRGLTGVGGSAEAFPGRMSKKKKNCVASVA